MISSYTDSDQSKVYLVDHDRSVLESMIGSIRVPVISYCSGEQFLAEFDPTQPGCIVLDVQLDGMNGLEVQRTLNQMHSSTPLIFATRKNEIASAVQAMKSGALEYFVKPIIENLFLTAIQKAIKLDAQYRHQRAIQNDIQSKINKLNEGEHKVLKLIVEGEANKQIAGELELSVRTIELRKSSIFKKMKVNSIGQLMRKAILVEQKNVIYHRKFALKS